MIAPKKINHTMANTSPNGTLWRCYTLVQWATILQVSSPNFGLHAVAKTSFNKVEVL